VTELRDHGSGCPLDASDDDLAWIPFTIDAAFDLIEQVADPESLEVYYDAELAYPFTIVDRFIAVGIDLAPGLPDRSGQEAAFAELAAHRDIWEEAGIRDYTFKVLRDVFLPAENRGPFTVTVQDGDVVSVLSPQGNTHLPQHLFTMERLFSTIDRGLDADVITVRYHPEQGYPIDIYIDPDRGAIDEERHYIVSDFEAQANE
jgi:hypothetical protein